jgi:hypothetical protein
MIDEENEELDNEESDGEDSESELAKEFEAHISAHQAEISAAEDKAIASLRKAVELADKYGVPYRFGISFLSNSYVPASFIDSKFRKLEDETVSDISGCWGDYIFEDSGWQHSAVC